MKSNKIAALAAALLCLTAFTACGEPVTENSAAPEIENAEVTTALTEETAETTDTAEADVTTTAADTDDTAATTAAADDKAAETTAEESSDSEESSENKNENKQDEKPAEQKEDPKPAETQAPAEEEPYLLDSLKIKQDCTDYVSKHKDYTFEEANSCLGSGKDRVYTYKDFELHTYFNGEKDLVAQIVFTTDKLKTRKDIHLGSTKADVVAAYGEPAEADFYMYETDDGRVQFFFDGDTVNRIDIYTLDVLGEG
ncbi:MAG: hypothetical protein IKQ91_05400 [Oscillospiraceae bacterium]|nr:hypothetical protein [Oscillospiraceae bacterium]